jgi:hypothetical protein
MTEIIAPPAHPKRRFPWWSLAALVLFVLLIAAAMWLADQRAILQCRLDVISWGGELDVQPAENSILAWLDPRYSEDVVGVHLFNTDVKDEDLSRLTVFKSLELLALNQTTISDSAMENVAQLSSVRRLNLYDTAISGTGLALLEDMPNLEEIWVGPSITNREMIALGRIKSLRTINVYSSPAVDDSGLEALRQLPELDILRISESAISAAAAAEFERANPGVLVRLLKLPEAAPAP